MIMDRLYHDAVTKSPVCVGLDTDYAYLPQCVKDADLPVEDKIFAFNKAVVDATRDLAGCFKLQIACYEAMGLPGLAAFAKTLAYVRQGGSVAITDAKRGDISSTAKQYATAHFTGDFESDLLTVNAYMGEDAVSPYYDYLKGYDKGLFLLVKTSNPSGKDFQDRDMEGLPFYQQMAKKVAQWGESFLGESGFSAIGAVTGCTYPEEFAAIHTLMPHTFFLIPGYGAQGGTGKDIAAFFRDGVCGVVNSSRGILCAHKGKTEGADFTVYTRKAVEDMIEDIQKWL